MRHPENNYGTTRSKKWTAFSDGCGRKRGKNSRAEATREDELRVYLRCEGRGTDSLRRGLKKKESVETDPWSKFRRRAKGHISSTLYRGR